MQSDIGCEAGLFHHNWGPDGAFTRSDSDSDKVSDSDNITVHSNGTKIRIRIGIGIGQCVRPTIRKLKLNIMSVFFLPHLESTSPGTLFFRGSIQAVLMFRKQIIINYHPSCASVESSVWSLFVSIKKWHKLEYLPRCSVHRTAQIGWQQK